VSTVFVAEGKTIKKIFNRGESDALEIGCAPGADALQELERCLEKIGHIRADPLGSAYH
jgi:hypothetical protein